MSPFDCIWRQSSSRRSILRAVGLASLVSTSGCLAHLLNQGIRERERNIVVTNSSDTVRSVMITVKDSQKERLFHWEHRIESGATMLAGTFQGFAHIIIIRVGDNDPRTAEYVPPTGDCDTETITINILDGGIPQIRSRCGDVSLEGSDN